MIKFLDLHKINEKYRKEILYKKQKNKGELFSFLYKIN